MAFAMRSFSTFLKKIEWLHLFAYLLCTSFFSVQMYKLVENLLVPTKTHTYVKEVPLKEHGLSPGREDLRAPIHETDSCERVWIRRHPCLHYRHKLGSILIIKLVNDQLGLTWWQ